jgi:protein-cysteine N-palmitoyltransferase HHAT
MLFCWVFNFSLLIASYIYDGFNFKNLFGDSFSFLVLFFSNKKDNYYKGMENWETYFKITFCKLISFNYDKYLNHKIKESKEEEEKVQTRKYKTTYDKRTNEIFEMEEYNLVQFLIYVFYIPLMLAGPLMSYNSFVSYLKRPTNFGMKRLMIYIFRFLNCLMILELFLHISYSNFMNEYRIWRYDEVKRPVMISSMTVSGKINFLKKYVFLCG